MWDFSGQTIIVTGGTRGIGRGLTEAFLKAGGRVIATYATNIDAANKMKEEVFELGDNLELKQFDVSNSSAVKEFFSYIESNYEGVDVLVNNSGIRRDAVVALMEEEDWDRVIDINLKGTYLMTKSVIPFMMKNRYGRIVNMSSIGGTLGLSGQANYAASKAGQMAMAKSLSKELGKKGITVNNVCPGFIETELIADLPPEQIKEYKKTIPVKKFGTIDDVANGVLFLASKGSSYITGTSLDITGGL